MRALLFILFLSLGLPVSGPATAAQAILAVTAATQAEQWQPQRVVVRVSISRQVLEVLHEGRKLYEWPVSTARKGKITPTGKWNGAEWLSRNHRSSLYNGAPMPYAIFFNGNYAIHGTNQISKLGRPASAGCIRLHPDHARILFNMVKSEGKKNLVVEVRR
ncbi:L,D-transpeptidase [Thioclava sp. FR2]|uniref:L,D-transpeptidase n=1 Tax=Thioclava sp. FR2 TaxID=3445780 RepID=UPI003EC02E2C